jgi:hypothetical protein
LRLVLTVLLMVAAVPARAEWVLNGESGIASYYADPSTVRKNGNLRRVWAVIDLKRRDPSGALSYRVLFEYDCKSEEGRILSRSTHAGPMARGDVLVSGDVGSEWHHIPPATPDEGMLRMACR